MTVKFEINCHYLSGRLFVVLEAFVSEPRDSVNGGVVKHGYIEVRRRFGLAVEAAA